MVKTYVFGHKSPDSDSITSSLVMANLEKELGNSDVKAYRLGNINKETEFILNYLNVEAPVNFWKVLKMVQMLFWLTTTLPPNQWIIWKMQIF